MAAGHIPHSLLPGWPSPIAGVRENLDFVLKDNGVGVSALSPDGIWVGDVQIATDFLSTYNGSAIEVVWYKKRKLINLDEQFDKNFDLAKFIRNGTATNITAANVGTFLAAITNNYRSLRAAINAASDIAAVNAINLNSGWPSNP